MFFFASFGKPLQAIFEFYLDLDPMKKYPIGIQDFSELRVGGYLYVDKTQLIHQMISRGKYYFLSRSRRFGKSLLISTLRYLFGGRRDLFENTWIGQESSFEWKEYPVLHFSFNTLGYEDLGLEKALNQEIDLKA